MKPTKKLFDPSSPAIVAAKEKLVADLQPVVAAAMRGIDFPIESEASFAVTATAESFADAAIAGVFEKTTARLVLKAQATALEKRKGRPSAA
jgi:hypothetical protein